MKGVYTQRRAKRQDGRNKTEALFESDVLKPRLAAKEIVDYWFEPFSINLDGCFYRPDFLVQKADGELVVYEIKALHRDMTPILTQEAKNKLNLLVNRYPFRVMVAAWNDYAGWHYFDVTG